MCTNRVLFMGAQLFEQFLARPDSCVFDANILAGLESAHDLDQPLMAEGEGTRESQRVALEAHEVEQKTLLTLAFTTKA